MIDLATKEDYLRSLPVFFQGLKENYVVSQKNYNDNLSRFFSELSSRNRVFVDLKKQADLFLSSEFSFFRYMSLDENAMSDYIGLILDPSGAHGQGDLFLNIFIDYLQQKGLEGVPRLQYSIKREYWANGRIDIFLHCSDTALIIENKPYATDQKDQLQRYFNHICTTYQNVFMIYLSRADEPSTYSISKDLYEKLRNSNKFRAIKLYDFSAKYLRTCYEKCESQKFRYFLYDLMEAMTSTFKSQEEVKDVDPK